MPPDGRIASSAIFLQISKAANLLPVGRGSQSHCTAPTGRGSRKQAHPLNNFPQLALVRGRKRQSNEATENQRCNKHIERYALPVPGWLSAGLEGFQGQLFLRRRIARCLVVRAQGGGGGIGEIDFVPLSLAIDRYAELVGCLGDLLGHDDTAFPAWAWINMTKRLLPNLFQPGSRAFSERSHTREEEPRGE